LYAQAYDGTAWSEWVGWTMASFVPDRPPEHVGGRHNEFLNSGSSDVYFGLSGNDTFFAFSNSPTFLGGVGADTYVVNGTANVRILDTGNSGGDTLVFSVLGNLQVAIVDGRHLLLTDQGALTKSVLIEDWQSSLSQLESYQLGS